MVAQMKQPDRTLVAALDPFMTAHGFKYIQSRGAYIRKSKTGFDEFVFSTYPLATGEKWEAGYHEGFYGIGLRSDAVQEIWNVLGISYGGDPKGHRGTVFRGVGAYGNYLAVDPLRDRELCLRFDHLEEDVAETVGRIAAMLEADGLAWYARYADPVALSQGINDPIEGRLHPLVNNYEQRPLVGVAAACVAEPGRVPELIAAYLAVARRDDEQYADQRAAMVPDFSKKFAQITDKARELGYLS